MSKLVRKTLAEIGPLTEKRKRELQKLMAMPGLGN
jgi:hypothetical protein